MSKNRDLYFNKYCRFAQDVPTYIAGLRNSPYKTHQRMAVALIPELKRLISEQQDLINDVKQGVVCN